MSGLRSCKAFHVDLVEIEDKDEVTVHSPHFDKVPW